MSQTPKVVQERILEQKAKAVQYYEAMPIYKYAAAFAGVSEDTLKIWRDDDEVFSDSLQKAKAEFVRKHGKKARPEFLLERLDKPNFAERKELTGADGEPLSVNVVNYADTDTK